MFKKIANGSSAYQLVRQQDSHVSRCLNLFNLPISISRSHSNRAIFVRREDHIHYVGRLLSGHMYAMYFGVLIIC